jgi:hypothetical protein
LRSDSQGCLNGIFVFPHSDSRPSSFRESAVRVAVAFLVSGDLGCPEVFVDFRGPMVLGASMPITAIQEDGYLRAGKDQVRCSAQFWYWANTNAVAQAKGVCRRSKRTFWARVTTSVSLHHGTDSV